MTFDSKRTYNVWKQLIGDEALCEALFDGRHVEAARERGLSSNEIAVLDWFGSQPGTRWNIENLRFRAALETGAVLSIHMPRTVLLLTNGDENWLQDIAFEYLSHYRWDSLGHHRLSECQRFGAYTRDRIMKRRATPRHLGAVLELELAVVDVLKRTVKTPAAHWESAAPSADELGATRPRVGELTRVLEQDVDLRPVFAASPEERAEPIARPTTWLIHVESLIDGHRMKVISEGAREILARCSGEKNTADIAAELEAEYELPAASVAALIGAWLGERILVSGRLQPPQ